MNPADSPDFSKWGQELSGRPIIVALAGPNGAGKTTFYETQLQPTGLRFLNADFLAREFEIDAYQAAGFAARLRHALVNSGESFIFETVFSDPVGDKIGFLKNALERGYKVVLLFIGLKNSSVSEQRVAIRTKEGGHDVPSSKLIERFPRTMANLKRAIQELPFVIVFDNNNPHLPFQLAAVFRNGKMEFSITPIPSWLDF